MSDKTLGLLAFRSIAFGARPLGVLLVILAAAVTAGPAVAQDVVKLKADQAAIIFVVSGQGRSGDMQVRDAQHQSPIWATLLSQASVRQFTVRPGAYSLDLSPGAKPIALAAVAGHATIVSLQGGAADGAYRWLAQSEVAPNEIDRTVLPNFIDENRIAESGYAPTSLDEHGAGLVFVFRSDL
jgi:hypothetical protein